MRDKVQIVKLSAAALGGTEIRCAPWIHSLALPLIPTMLLPSEVEGLPCQSTVLSLWKKTIRSEYGA